MRLTRLTYFYRQGSQDVPRDLIDSQPRNIFRPSLGYREDPKYTMEPASWPPSELTTVIRQPLDFSRPGVKVRGDMDRRLLQDKPRIRGLQRTRQQAREYRENRLEFTRISDELPQKLSGR